MILLAYKAHSELPVVVAANRDERYDRPSRPAGFWPDHPELLAGMDLEAGGTWLGITRNGRFAAVTNFRAGQRRAGTFRSRGELTREFLVGGASPADYARDVVRRGADYQGFNLLLGNMDELVYCENLNHRWERLQPGIYGLSNHLLDTPWPKVISGKNRLTQVLTQWHSSSRAETGQLLDILTDRNIAEDEFLPDTGVGLEAERHLSPIFIEAGQYGTCASTGIIVDETGRTTFHERSFYDREPHEELHQFQLSG
ncbi:NRDE family protein [Gilvimarinus sp. F26214L]|uniref:NRDE family protein n=1 Tax=Gilvimarinus sp. DZF01 TaxID=3461371 RepID=UPI0040464F33